MSVPGRTRCNDVVQSNPPTPRGVRVPLGYGHIIYAALFFVLASRTFIGPLSPLALVKGSLHIHTCPQPSRLCCSRAPLSMHWIGGGERGWHGHAWILLVCFFKVLTFVLLLNLLLYRTLQMSQLKQDKFTNLQLAGAVAEHFYKEEKCKIPECGRQMRFCFSGVRSRLMKQGKNNSLPAEELLP